MSGWHAQTTQLEGKLGGITSTVMKKINASGFLISGIYTNLPFGLMSLFAPGVWGNVPVFLTTPSINHKNVNI